MAHVETAVAQAQLHLGGQPQQAEEIGHSGAFLADALAQAFLRQVVLVYEFAERQGNFNGIEVLALDILDKGHLGQFHVVGRTDVRRHRLQPGEHRGTVAPFAGYDLV